MSALSPIEQELYVICVDDDQEFLQSMNLMLSNSINSGGNDDVWFRFSFYAHPAEALDAIKEITEMNEEVAMVISDQNMPYMKGTDFLQEVKKIVPLASCILLTGYAGIDSAIEAINSKILDKYLTKPIDDEQDFLFWITQLLNNYQQEKTITRQRKMINDLYAFSNELNAIEELDEALNYIVDFSTQILACERISIMLLKEDDKKFLKIAAARGLSMDVFHKTLILVGDGVAGKVFEKREAAFARDASKIEYLSNDNDLTNSIFISVPMLWAGLQSGQQPLGVINATNKKDEHTFTQTDLEALTYIANTASIVIHNHLSRMQLKDSLIEAKTQAAALAHLTRYDQVTGLPNKTMLVKSLHEYTEGSAGANKLVALLMLDVSHFREINDAIGHDNGNKLLQGIGERFASLADNTGQIFSLGRDEFALMLLGGGIAEAEQAIQNSRQVLQAPFVIESTNIDISMNIGIALCPDHAIDNELLIQRADVATYQCKGSGKDYYLYDAEKDKSNAHRLQMVNELRHAIAADELVLYYQPKINLVTGEVDGAEALVRWIHPVRGFTPPDQFISLAEQVGLIEALTEWVLVTAVRQCRYWNDLPGSDHRISVAINLSVLNLVEDGFSEKLAGICASAGIASDQLELEITENIIMDSTGVAIEALNELSAKGFKIAVDDFGTGYSSLAYIKSLPVDYLKIDRGFIREIDADGQDLHIVNSIVELGHNLNLKVIAEGVENELGVAKLIELGCDIAQGYYYSRPLPPAEFEALVNEWQPEKTKQSLAG